MKTRVATAVMATVLAGCAATGDDYVRGVRPPVETHPTLGQLTVSAADLLGPDADQNGVRDEIDKTIRATFPSAPGRQAATRFAVALSRAMIAGLNDKTPSDSEKQEYVAAFACLDSINSGTSDIMLAQTVRTPNRAAAMMKWQRLAGTLPSLATCPATADKSAHAIGKIGESTACELQTSAALPQSPTASRDARTRLLQSAPAFGRPGRSGWRPA